MSRAEDSWVAKIWYGNSPLVWILVPFSWLYAAIINVRSALYRCKILPALAVGVPVVVVGNITVGGTGKTPLTIWLAGELKARGFSPGIVSRGYRGSVGAEPVEATPQSDPSVVGDEAVLLSSQSKCPVVVHPDRIAAAARAIELGANVIVADDGLQHYRLVRDVEIAVIDGHRGFGNGRLLPAGPLREKPGRLEAVDKVVVQRRLTRPDNVLRRASDRQPLHFSLKPVAIRRLDNTEVSSLAEFAGRKVHALAGIGNPERFFRMLESHGMIVKRHPLPDHAKISAVDVTFDDSFPVIMTAKDAVKCRFPEARQCWSVEVDVEFEGEEGDMLLDLVVRNIEAEEPVT